MLFQKLGYTDVKTKIMFIENKIAFWTFLEEEAISANSTESGFILQFDGNL